MRFVVRCDVFNLPILQLVDVPGYAVGTGIFIDTRYHVNVH